MGALSLSRRWLRKGIYKPPLYYGLGFPSSITFRQAFIYFFISSLAIHFVILFRTLCARAMFAQSLIVALAGASILSQVAAQADTPEVVFDCSVTPGVCTNMCFGAYCRGYDVTLNYDKPSDSTKTDRRNKAGCTKKNRCSGGNSPDPDGPSCDEYPFASTSNADDVQAVNRCVPVAEQNSMTFAHNN